MDTPDGKKPLNAIQQEIERRKGKEYQMYDRQWRKLQMKQLTREIRMQRADQDQDQHPCKGEEKNENAAN